MRILVAEDAHRLAEAVAEILRVQGYAARIAESGPEALELLAEDSFDVALLDIMLPGRDGLSVLADMRAAGDATPVILLTARGDVQDRVRGLDAGADDYLPKPFHASELLARIRAVTRRPPALATTAPLRAFDVVFDAEAMTLAVGEPGVQQNGLVFLSVKECQLMGLLMEHPGRVVSKGRMFEALWGARAATDARGGNRVEALIYALREKLAEIGARARIVTVRGAGYALREGPEASAQGD